MSGKSVSFARSTAAAIQHQRPITNVVDLFEALAVGWTLGGEKRYLMAAQDTPFVRTNPRAPTSQFGRMDAGDIPVIVLGHGYNMRGFVQFETQYLYRGMFETEQGDDRTWYRAWLTEAGFQFAQCAVFDVARLHRDIAACPFFHPAAKDADADLALPSAAVTVKALP